MWSTKTLSSIEIYNADLERRRKKSMNERHQIFITSFLLGIFLFIITKDLLAAIFPIGGYLYGVHIRAKEFLEESESLKTGDNLDTE